MTTSYRNFDLLIERRGRGYRARAQESSAGEAASDFELPFTPEELLSFNWLTGRVAQRLGVSRSARPAPPNPPNIHEFGERLFNAAFAGDVGGLLLRSVDDARNSEVGVRIRLRLDDDVGELAELPWEYLYDQRLGGYLALSDRTVLVRYVQRPQPPQALSVRPPLVVMALVSQPNDVPELRVNEEWASLDQALAGLQGQGLLRVERLPAATPQALLERLRGDPVHVLHFIGHGYFDAEANEAGVVLEDGNRDPDFVSAERFGTILRDHTTLRLVFLNSCEGARTNQDNAFAGLAQQLVMLGLPAVLGMQFSISDSASLALSKAFYEAIAAGEPVDLAVTRARKALHVTDASGTGAEWGTPVLFTRSPDNRILSLPKGDARPIIPIQSWEPETVPVAAGSFVMGAGKDFAGPDWEMPLQALSLSAYRIGKHLVTNAQYLAYIRARRVGVAPETGWALAQFGREPPSGREAHPVVGVTWDDAVAYCEWLCEETGRQYRLPSEAEWEKAARGAALSPEDARVYPWGNAFDPSRCNCAETGRGDTTPAGSFSPQGDSPFGCTDMAGNVWEWTSTRWGAERSQPQYGHPYDPMDGRESLERDEPFREYRVLRGGSYRDNASRVTCTARARDAADKRHSRRGFRVAMDIPTDGDSERKRITARRKGS